MAIEKIGVEIEVKTKNAGKAIKEVTGSLNDFNRSLDKNREGLKILDQITGGAVSQFRDFQASTKGGVAAVKQLANGFKGLKTAVLATGIGAIVVALGVIVVYWDDIKKLIGGASVELEKQEEKIRSQISEQQTQISLIESQLKLETLKTGEGTQFTKELKKQLLIQQEQNKELIKNLENQLKLSKGKKGQREAEEAVLTALFGQETTKKLLVKVEKEEEKIIKKINEVKKQSIGIEIKLAQIDAEVIRKKKKNREEEEKREKEINDIKKALDLELEKLRIKNIQDKEKRELAALESERVRAREVLVEKGANNELLLAFDTRYQQRKKEIEDNFQQQKDEKRKVVEDAIAKAEQDFLNSKLEKDKLEIQSVNDKYAKLIESANKHNLDTTTLLKNQTAEIKAIEDKKAKEDLAREQMLKAQKLALIGDTFGQVAKILGKNSAAGRAAAIAQATINTYQGVTQVWKSESVLPEPLATINKVVSTATVLASGLQAVKKIKSTPKPQGLPSSGGSDGGGGGGGASVSPPSFNVVGASGTSQLADAIATQTNEPQRAYVVSGDVTTAQEMERNTISGASI